MIELRNLGMSYRLENERIEVLKAADLVLHDRESVAIVGPSGDRKSVV